MRYLRMLTNAVAGGVLMALYVAVLILQVNPRLSVLSATSLRWGGAVLALYTPYLSVGLFFAIVLWELVTGRWVHPAWLSVRLLAWVGTAGATTAAVLTWLNLETFRAVLTEGSAVRMHDGAVVLSVAAGLLLVLAVFRQWVLPKGHRLTAAVLVGLTSGSVAVPLWLRGPGELPVPPAHRWSPPERAPGQQRVRLLLLDGASLGFIRQRVAAGQLRNLDVLLSRGAVLDLATMRPTQAEPVWVAAATGKLPQQNGVRSNGVYRVDEGDTDVDVLPDDCFAYALVSQGFVRAIDHSPATLAARPLWDIVGDYGVTSGVSNWPLTYPARTRLGYVVSDRFDEAASSPLRLGDAGAADPTTAIDVARETFDVWQKRPWFDVLRTFFKDEVEPVDVNRARWDRAYSDTATALDAQFAPRLTAVRYEGLDSFGHSYFRQALPELFGDPRSIEPQRSVLDRYYSYVDAEVGRAVEQLAAGDLLLVMSGFGMEPTPLGKRLFAGLLGERVVTGTHESGPDGFLLAYGSNVAAGALSRGSVVDLTPTLLYYLGIPVGRDMDGTARTDLFLTEYAREHPVKYVASHER